MFCISVSTNIKKQKCAMENDDYNLKGNEGEAANNSSNKIKDPDEWTTGSEPMTDAQKSYLQTLKGNPVDESLTKATASSMIDEAKNKVDSKTSEPLHNAIKDPKDWVTGSEEMTDAQRSYLKTLSDEAGETVDENLSKASASEKIEDLQQKTGRGLNNDKATD